MTAAASNYFSFCSKRNFIFLMYFYAVSCLFFLLHIFSSLSLSDAGCLPKRVTACHMYSETNRSYRKREEFHHMYHKADLLGKTDLGHLCTRTGIGVGRKFLLFHRTFGNLFHSILFLTQLFVNDERLKRRRQYFFFLPCIVPTVGTRGQ